MRLLGGLSVEGRAERDLGSRKGRTLLKVLAVARGAPVPIEGLADVLWGADLPARPAEQVGVLVSRLRAALGPDRLVRTDGGYALRCAWLDIEELAVRVSDAETALSEGRTAAARAAAEAALALARGPVLPDDEGSWLEAERVTASALTSRARLIAAEGAARAGEHGAAGALAEVALAHDPYDEPALRVLMRALTAAGRSASALAAYGRVRARLAEDLGVSPSAETESLHDAVLLQGDRPVDASAPTPPPMVGRDAEVVRLDRVLARAIGGGVGVAQVIGAAGIGKSTLVRGWAAQIDDPSITVLRGSCDALGRDLPLQPVIDALATHLAGLGADAAHAVLEADVDVLGPLLGFDRPQRTEATALVDADAGRLQLFTALLGAAVRTGGGQPTVLVVEDLHLAGPSTVSWLAFVARRPGVACVVTTARPGGAELPGAETIALGPVDRAAVAALVGEARADDLHRRSGGHPLLLVALAGAPEGQLPVSIVDAVHEWLGGIRPAVPTIEAAAVLGTDADLDLLADVLRVPAVTILEHLDAAAGAGLLVERGAGYAFRHELVREALDRSVGSAHRAFVHRAAARSLRDRPGADPLTVATHARQGGDRHAASDAFVAAAEVAAGRFDLDTAEEHLDAAVSLVASARALTARARLRIARLSLDDAARDAEAALAAGGGGDALEVAGWVAYYQRRYGDARRFADEGVERADDPAVRSSCLALGGRARHGAGDLEGGVARLEAAASSPAPHQVRGVAEVWLAQARLHQGRPIDALDAAGLALVDPAHLAHPFAALHGHFTRVLALGQMGRPADALAAADEMDRVVERSGTVGLRFLGPAANARAWVLRWTGRAQEADDRNHAAVEASLDSGTMLEAGYAALLDLADGRVLVGDLPGAAELEVRLRVVDSWQGTMAWCQRHRLGCLRARLALADRDHDRAAELALDVARDAIARGAHRHALLARALAGMAGGVPVQDLQEVVDGLAACAGLDGWRAVAELATAHDVADWRVAADARAAALVAASDDPDAARRLVDTVLSGT